MTTGARQRSTAALRLLRLVQSLSLLCQILRGRAAQEEPNRLFIGGQAVVNESGRAAGNAPMVAPLPPPAMAPMAAPVPTDPATIRAD